MNKQLVEDLYIRAGLDVLAAINKELQHNNIINIDYLLLRMSSVLSLDVSIPKDELTNIVIEEVNKLLVKNSNTYREICDNEEYSNAYLFANSYMKKVLNYYNGLMATNRDKFDRYVEITNGAMPKKKIIKSEGLYMSIDDIQNTLQLLNEAVRNYYEIYNKKTLFVTFTDEQIIEFKIKEGQLAHLLGVNLRKIVNNPTFVDLFHITQKEIEWINDTTYTLDPNGNAAIDVLHKIIDMSSGNLLQYEEDRLKKIDKGHTYRTMDFGTEDSSLQNYSKINMRSKSFIDFKPLEELSLALNFPDGYQLIGRNKESGKDSRHSLLVSKNSLSDHFKYSTLITNFDSSQDRRYFESLFLVEPNGMEEWQKVASPSISTRVELDNDGGGPLGGGGGGIVTTFSVEQQKAFLEEIRKDFLGLDLSDVANYFRDLGKDLKPPPPPKTR